MKKLCCAALTLMLLTLLCVPALADTWYCPQCGRLNDNNFCPVDGTARPADTGGGVSGGYTQYAYVTGTLNARLATRTGPGTQYDEPGSFLSAGSKVTVLSKAYDQRNGIWWVKCEIPYKKEIRVLWTGWKRFDHNVTDLESIPIDPEY